MSIDARDLLSSADKTAKSINFEDATDFAFRPSKTGTKKTKQTASEDAFIKYEQMISGAKNRVSGWALFEQKQTLEVSKDINSKGTFVTEYIEALARVERDDDKKYIKGNYMWLASKNVPGIIPVSTETDGDYTVLKAAINKGEKPIAKLSENIKNTYYKDIFIGIMNIIRCYINRLDTSEKYKPLLSITPETVYAEIVENGMDGTEVHIRILPLWPVNNEYSPYIPREKKYTVLSDLYSAAYIFIELAGKDRAATIPNEIKSCLYPIAYMRTDLEVLSGVIKENYQQELGRIRHGSGSVVFEDDAEAPHRTDEAEFQQKASRAFVYEDEQQEDNKKQAVNFTEKFSDILSFAGKLGKHATKQAQKVVNNIKSTNESKNHDFDIMHQGTLGESKGE